MSTGSPAPTRADLPHAVVIAAVAAASFAAGLTAFGWSHETRQRSSVAAALTQGHADRAPPLLRRYGCTGCHSIANVAGADGKVGGDLSGLRSRVYIAGALPNTADNLVRWIVAPRAIDPTTAMPATGISDSEARDVAAYLYAQR